jgi:hypothetical protein
MNTILHENQENVRINEDNFAEEEEGGVYMVLSW